MSDISPDDIDFYVEDTASYAADAAYLADWDITPPKGQVSSDQLLSADAYTLPTIDSNVFSYYPASERKNEGKMKVPSTKFEKKQASSSSPLRNYARKVLVKLGAREQT